MYRGIYMFTTKYGIVGNFFIKFVTIIIASLHFDISVQNIG